MKHTVPLLALLFASPASAQFVVIDPAVVEQVVQQVTLTLEQLNQLKTEVDRLGDPAAVTLNIACRLQGQLAQMASGAPLRRSRRPPAAARPSLTTATASIVRPARSSLRPTDAKPRASLRNTANSMR